MYPTAAKMLLSACVLFAILTTSNGDQPAKTTSSNRSCQWRPIASGGMFCYTTNGPKKTPNMVDRKLPSETSTAICQWPKSPHVAKLLSAMTSVRLLCDFGSVEGVPIIDAATFRSAVNLNIFTISDVPIASTLRPETFCDLPKLTILELHQAGISDLNHIGLESGGQCHSSCRATGQLKTLSLTRNNISSLRNEKPFCSLTNVELLNLRQNRLTNIDPEVFANLVNLKNLYLTNNSLTVLAKGTFKTQKNLQTLDAAKNRLRNIDGAFDGLHKLTTLLLDNNQLTNLTRKTFAETPNLLTLIVSHNRIDLIERGTFATLKSLQNVELNDNRIAALPSGNTVEDALENLNTADLSQNAISEIGTGMWPLSAGVGLKKLNINHNRLSRLTPDTFANQKQLEFLFLEENLIEYIDGSAFPVNNSLIFLRLAGNRLTDMPDLSRLTTLWMLDLSRNLIEVLTQDCLIHNVNVTALYLRGNRLQTLSDNLFRHLPKLVILDLAENGITTIGNDTFAGLSRLIILHMQNNRLNFSSNIHELAVASTNGTFAIMNVFGPTQELYMLNLSGNGIESFEYYWFPVNITELLLSNNNIQLIPTPSSDLPVQYPTQLTRLDLSLNLIEAIPRNSILQGIGELNLNDNRIGGSLPGHIQKMRSLNTVSLERNRIEKIPRTHVTEALASFRFSGNPLICDCHLDWMRVNNKPILDFQELTCTLAFRKRATTNGSSNATISRITDVAAEHFLCEYMALRYEPRGSTVTCSLSHAYRCNTICPEQCRCYHNANYEWITIDCSFASLDFIPIGMPLKTTTLFMDSNALSNVHDVDLNWLSALRQLYLNANVMELLDADAFVSLEALQTLHLDHNQLTHLAPDQFESQTNLLTLDLSHNRLANLSSAIFEALISLQTLYLNGNQLVDFPVWLLPPAMEIGLNANPWSCDCDYTLSYSHWIGNFTGRVIDKQDLKCVMHSGALVSLATFNGSKCYESMVFVAPAWYSKMWIVSFPVVIIAIALMVFVYRQEVQVLIYWHMGMRVFHRNQQAEHDADKEYDAFVSYSSADERFIVNDLLPGLEKDVAIPYKLCLHHRDFLGGAYINESICNAIANSRRTLLILSKNFVRSDWCRLEFKAAHSQMIIDRCKRVVVIVLGEIPDKLGPEIQLYLRTNTYLVWGDNLFWKKLYFALPDRKRATPPVDENALLTHQV